MPKGSRNKSQSIKLVLVLAVLVGLASILPLIWSLTRPMSGFIYSPFYTTNNFCDATVKGCQILHPEDRVIEVDHQRIDQLNQLTGQGGTLLLVYELVHALISFLAQTQAWTAGRLLEKSGPLLASGFVLIWFAISELRRNKSGEIAPETKSLLQKAIAAKSATNWLLLSVVLSGLGLLAAPDFYLAPGAGLTSGFDPVAHWHAGEYLALTAKWSTYLYYPIWTLAAATLATYHLQQLLNGLRWRVWAIAVGWLLIGIDLIDYLYSAYLTHHYNNPDYYVWHTRSEFWPLWGCVLLLIWLPAIRSLRQTVLVSLLSRLAFTLFLFGFIMPTVFDVTLPAFGVQWWAVAIIFYYRLRTFPKNPAN